MSSAVKESAGDHIEKMAQQAIGEARMVLPGIQALFGFQLIAVFNERFKQLPADQQNLHFAAVLLITLAIALIMAPAAYHRQVHPGTVNAFFVKLASCFVTAAMLPLMGGLSLDVYLLGCIVLESEHLSLTFALLLFGMFAALWFVFPQLMRRWRGRG